MLKDRLIEKKFDPKWYRQFDPKWYHFFAQKRHILLQNIQMQLGMIIALSTKVKDTLLILLRRHYSVNPALYLFRTLRVILFSFIKGGDFLMITLSELNKLNVVELKKIKEKIEYILSEKERKQKNHQIKPVDKSNAFLNHFYKIVLAMLKRHTAKSYPVRIDMLKVTPRYYNDFVETHQVIEEYLLNILPYPKFEERMGFYSLVCVSIQKYMLTYHVPFSLAAFINCKEKFTMIFERELPYLTEDQNFLATILRKGNQIKF